MDPNSVVLEISSDEDDDHNWLTELLGDEMTESNGDEVVVLVNECEKPVKKPELKSSLVDLNDDDDCVVLDEDPNVCVEIKNGDSGNGGDEDSDDIVVVSEKGQVACRDYPHSRHLCIKFPFSSTPNQSHCNQCYCYVCDSLAPCVFWGNGSASTDHCHATDKDEFWVLERKNAKNGGKVVQPVSQVPPIDLYAPAPVMVQPQNQIPNLGPVHANHSSVNFQSANIISQYRNNILASRNKLHPDLASQLMLRVQQRYNGGPRVHRPVFKRTGLVRAATANQNRYSSYRGNLGNPIRQQYLGSLQPNAVNTSVSYPPQSQTYTYSTVNQPQPQFSCHSNPHIQSQSQTYTYSTVNQSQSQFSYHSNPSIQSHVNSDPIPSNPLYQVPVVPPSSSRPQLESCQQTYMMPVQPSYHVPSKTQVDIPLVSVSDTTQNASQGDQPQGPIVDSVFKDNGLGLPTGQDFAANESSLVAVSDSLADYRFDWIFDNQPIEPGFTDYSSDAAFIDTGPIFDF